MSITIYHNPRCSKSRQTLALLEEKNLDINVIEYLNVPPDAQTLKKVLGYLGLSPRELLRTHEAEYKQAGLDKDGVSDDQIIEAMIQYPKLIERPIVINGDKAAIGRPPETVLNILD